MNSKHRWQFRAMASDHAGRGAGDRTAAVAAFLDALPTPSVLIDQSGRALRWNALAARLFSWPVKSDEPRVFFRSDALWFRRMRDRAAVNTQPVTIMLRRGAGRRPGRVRAAFTALRDGRGRVTGLLVCFESTHRFSKLRTELRESERRYADLVEFSPDAIAIHDEHFLYVNPAACRLIGAERPEDLLGRSVLDFVHPDEREAIRAVPARLPEGRRSARTLERKLLRLDGQVIDAEVVAVPIMYRRSPAFQVVIRDVTRQKRAESGLRVIQERFRLLAEGVRDYAIIMLDARGAVVSWNRGAERLTGLRTDEVVRAHFHVLFPSDEREAGRAEHILAQALSQGRCEDEGWCVRSGGVRFWASVAVTTLQSSDGKGVGFAVIVRDLTERKEAEARLRRSEDHLRQAQKMEGIGRLAGGIAHDFNNLLTAIQGHAQFMLEDLPEGGTARADAEEIRKAADRAAALTRQLLTFSRRQVLEPQVIDLNSIIGDLNKMLRRVIREDVDLVTALADDAWSIYADAGQIEQVLMNLVVNSRDAMPRGGTVTVATRNVEVGEEYAMGGAGPQPGPYVQLTVSDTGIGMDKDTQVRIFEPFFTTKPEGQGTGLGLATVYGIVQQSGGHISVYSEPGQGTMFRILLPRHRERSEAAEKPAVQPSSRHGCEAVLVVEDDPAVRALTRRVLQERGYSVLEAGDGTEALRLAEEYDGPIDLLVTDIVMPEMSGRKLAENLRTMHPAAKILFMSGFTETDVIQQGLLEPGAAFVEKPFSPDGLAERVREALDG